MILLINPFAILVRYSWLNEETTSSFILPMAYALRYVIFQLDYLYGALMLITGILFIVDFKVPKVQSKGLAALGVLVIVELIQIVVTI